MDTKPNDFYAARVKVSLTEYRVSRPGRRYWKMAGIWLAVVRIVCISSDQIEIYFKNFFQWNGWCCNGMQREYLLITMRNILTVRDNVNYRAKSMNRWACANGHNLFLPICAINIDTRISFFFFFNRAR